MAKNKHNQIVGSTIERSDERIKETQEVFTPMELVEEMIDEIPEELLKDPSSTFIDNSAGCGNFLVGLKKRLLQYHDEKHILDNMLYAVEMMEDNHRELCERLGVPVTHRHYVCADALTYNYSFGEPVGLDKFF
jgi:type I restriction-modification system DNA methylase subunit